VAPPKARPTRSEARTTEQAARAKPRPWWLPEPDRSRKAPAKNGVGANNAPIFD
jgi:hypothetical protein